MTRLPPGQIETRRFPVVGERTPSADLKEDPLSWSLQVGGMVSTPFSLHLPELFEIATSELVFDIHCVTSWTRFGSRFVGLPLRELLMKANPSPEARFVSFEAYSDRDHHTSLPVDLAMEHSWVVHSFDDEPLTAEHGGPVRVVTPGRYFYKSIKWLKRVVLLEDDRPGWWESNSSYHENADPTSGTERFSTGSIRPEQLRRFIDAYSYDKYRNRVFLGLDLKEWSPQTKDLSRLYLKFCDLRGVDLTGADLRESNLSLSDLRGAVLVGADLSGSDLEGANLVGADLTNSSLNDTALSATRFVSSDGQAKVDGMTLTGARGVLEDQERFLKVQGVAGTF